MFQEILMFQNKVAALHLDEMNTQRSSSFLSESTIVGPEHNDTKI